MKTVTLKHIAARHSRPLTEIEEWFLERASIREFNAGIPRAKAEQLALQDVEDELSARPHGNRPTRARAHKREPIVDRDPGDESP